MAAVTKTGVLVAEVQQADQVLFELGLDAADLLAGQVGHDQLVAASLELQLVAGAEFGGGLGAPHVGELRDGGLAALLDEQARIDGRRVRRRGAFGGELAQSLQVLGGDAIQRIQLDRVGVRVARFGIAAELGQRFAEAVVGIHLVGKDIEDFAVDLGSLVPAILHRQA